MKQFKFLQMHMICNTVQEVLTLQRIALQNFVHMIFYNEGLACQLGYLSQNRPASLLLVVDDYDLVVGGT